MVREGEGNANMEMANSSMVLNNIMTVFYKFGKAQLPHYL